MRSEHVVKLTRRKSRGEIGSAFALQFRILRKLAREHVGESLSLRLIHTVNGHRASFNVTQQRCDDTSDPGKQGMLLSGSPVLASALPKRLHAAVLETRFDVRESQFQHVHA